MNNALFFLDDNPHNAVQMLHDRDVKNSIIDVGQCLVDVWWAYWGATNLPLKEFESRFGCELSSYRTRPPVYSWVGETRANYNWAARYLVGLLIEHRIRFPSAARRSNFEGLAWVNRQEAPTALGGDKFTFPPQEVPADCQRKPSEYIQAYRAYYGKYRTMYMSKSGVDGKPKFTPNSWSKRNIPVFVTQQFTLQTLPKE